MIRSPFTIVSLPMYLQFCILQYVVTVSIFTGAFFVLMFLFFQLCNLNLKLSERNCLSLCFFSCSVTGLVPAIMISQLLMRVSRRPLHTNIIPTAIYCGWCRKGADLAKSVHEPHFIQTTIISCFF